ncbi:protein phosphatase 1 regulatory subunit 15B [Anarrhichthys ocellatus]|uniref:protein phosphatase 1 regulatory subunit 15B n=1 Tax=Anarrhichthys ocellatus TaxID=433405 RepID=UPI0012ECF925|nr:protein phosphatase 1 regulatory subunit 15B-like [Anarrhichthys ocellatus]
MLRNMSGEGHLSSGQGSSSTAGRGVTSPGLDGQESSWIGLLPRATMAFLQRYFLGRPPTPKRSETGAGWISGGLKTSFVDEETGFLRLDDMMPLTQHPAPHLTYLRCQHEGASGQLEPRGSSRVTWLTADSLQEMGIQATSEEEMDLNLCQQTQIGYLSSSVGTFLSHVLLSSESSQEIKPPGGGKSRTWWGSFWVGEESSKTKAPETTTDPFGGWTLGENAGPTDLKEVNNGGLQTVQNTERSTTDHRLTISNHHLSCSGAAVACSEAALPTPDQDNGYSSLEEEHFQVCHLSVAKAQSEEQQQPEEEEADSAEISAAVKTEMEEETSEEEEKEESVEATALTNPECQNKAIAFIMGCPCSDDDSNSQSDGESSDDDDDDAGFDSEGSSDESDSTDDEEEDDDEEDDEDSEVDSEAERLWSSLCQSVDPYNPSNFTAQLHTVTSSPPRTIPTSTPPSSAQSTPASSPPSLPPSTLTSSSPPSGSDFWDDSTSASEVDEAESLRLLSSFSCSLDPYSPLNFQATLMTQRPVQKAGSRTRTTRAKKEASQSPPRFLRHNPASPPEYRKEEAEERLDSGFSEPSTSSGCSTSQSCSTTKKVRFCDDVEEFFASCGEEEDRRGPWEELARDRFRFLRRCQEVEQSIAFCLQPQHRHLVYRRLVSVLYVQDA